MLVVSNRRPGHNKGYERGERAERCAVAGGETVMCFRSEPHATQDARAVGDPIEQRDRDRIVVVTDRYHLRAPGCWCASVPDADVELVTAGDSLRPDRVLRESLAGRLLDGAPGVLALGTLAAPSVRRSGPALTPERSR